MAVSEVGDHTPVGFLWKRDAAITRAQTRFDVPDERDTGIEGAERAR